MAKRKSSIILSEFIPEGERKEDGPTTRVRTFAPDVHYKLCRLAVAYGEKNGFAMKFAPGVFTSSDLRSELHVYRAEFSTYFTNDEYTHFAEYLRGAADALELKD